MVAKPIAVDFKTAILQLPRNYARERCGDWTPVLSRWISHI
jgi:hypothetical protein